MRRFPEAGQIKMEMVPDHLLGYSFLPGGNLATYHVGKLNYRQFLAHLKTSDDSPGVLVGVRKALENPQYLAHMGGYYGTDHGRPVYLFVKGPWVAGVEGLPEPKADEIARQFALHF